MNPNVTDDQLVAELFDAQPQPVFFLMPIWDEEHVEVIDFSYAYCNEEMYRYTGLNAEQLLGAKITTTPTLNEEGRKKALIEIREIFQTGVQQQQTFFNPKLNKYYSFIRSKVRGGILTILQDRSQEYEMINELERQKALLKGVFNTAQAGLFTLMPVRDDAGEIVDFRFGIVNQSVAGYIGQTAEALTGSLGSTYFPAYQTNGLFDIYKDTYLTNTPHQFDFHYDDGYDVFFNIQTVKTGDEVLVTFTDHTTLKRLQRELETTIEELKRSNSNLEEFAYAASHDLKEPIRKIHFFADRLKEGLHDQLDEVNKRLFDRMQVATERMRSLVDDLLMYSQVSLRPRIFDDVDLNQLVQLVLSDLELEIEEKKATVTLAPLPVVKGHMRQLQQLFQNLLGNALKYSDPGVAPRITVSCDTVTGKDSGLHLPTDELQKNFHSITVTDNGIGFDQKDAERIFNVFQRLHGNTEYRGTGVGLSIARKVAENHNGYISASSEPGKGARFLVLLPSPLSPGGGT